LPKHRIETAVTSNAPRSRVWEVLDQADRWHEWGPWRTTGLEREGNPPPGGTGAIRVLKAPGMTLREEIVAHEPQSHHAYEVLSGLPVRNYHADVRLSGDEAGPTEISWIAEFDGSFPGAGTAMKLFLGRAIPDVAKRVARQAERR
jgi:hypothetical protein